MLRKSHALCFALLASSHAQAWEIDVHAWITLRAYERSNLNPSGPNGQVLLGRLGFDRYDTKSIFRSPGLTILGGEPSDKYFDLLANWDEIAPNPAVPTISNRFPNDWEHSRFPEGYRLGANSGALGTTPQLRLEAWLMRGVVREDDVRPSEYLAPPIPDPDPYGNITRVFGHFYDPINDDGLPSVPFVIDEQRVKSINWAMGVEESLAPSPNPLLSRRNHFSWADARRAYFQALTYQTADATLAPLTDEIESEVRLFFLATTVKALGQVLHVLQDGSQPQHSRLDAHNHSNHPFLSIFNKKLPRRMIEVYTNLRVTLDLNLATNVDREPLRSMFTDASGNLENLPALPVGNYPIPQFAVPRRFMTTRTQAGGDVLNERKGLFDYSNRGFFSEGTANGRSNLQLRTLPSPPPDNVGASSALIDEGDGPEEDLAWTVPDAVAPGYIDAIDAAYLGKVPLGGINYFSAVSNRPVKVNLATRHYRNHANVLIPRAIAYSAGMLNYFFRGTLEIEPIEQKVFAVANQGEPHTIDGGGWPRKTAGGGVFGFEKVRLKVRNTTDPITEPGVGGTPTAQSVTSGGQLYAIARYHRNLCYKADLSGERTQTFPTPPLVVGIITEPTCGALGPRTVFQDISVSAPLAINSVADLPGGAGAPLPNSVEKTFDFSGDPIPINATDLILQVVYRGTLGEEPESVALGTLDVREPTIMTFWENTDYFVDATTPPWRAFNNSYPVRPIQYFRFCIGPIAAERLGYWFAPPLAGNAMMNRGSVRVAVIVPQPSSPTDTFRVKATPVAPTPGPNGQMQALVRTSVGRIAQSNREYISTTTAASPQADCNNALPSAEQYWCNDPLQRRRQLILGSRLQPMAWFSTSASGFNTPDVAEIMTNVPSSVVQPLGEVRFNDLGALTNCPPVPTEAADTESKIRLNELEEVARSLGIKL